MARAPCPSLRRQGSRHVPPDPCRGPPPGFRGPFDFKSLTYLGSPSKDMSILLLMILGIMRYE